MADERSAATMLQEIEFAPDSPLEGAGFEPSVPRQESRRFEPASVPSRVGRCRRGGYGPGGDRRPDRAVEIADRRRCASEPPLESRIKPSRRVGPSRRTEGSNPSPSSGESGANRNRPAVISRPGDHVIGRSNDVGQAFSRNDVERGEGRHMPKVARVGSKSIKAASADQTRIECGSRSSGAHIA
jgi:hypothetical protein